MKLTESQFNNIIRESVRKILSELDWKTNMNASRKRKAQADDLRAEYQKDFPNSSLANKRNAYDDMADELEKHAQNRFKNSHNDPSLTHGSERDGWWNGEKAHITHTRKGNGIPYREYGRVTDETFDDALGDGFTGDNHRKHTTHINADGAKYDPNLSTVGNEISYSKNQKYNDAIDAMTNDMADYYTGKSHYTKGKGWNIDEAISKAIRKSLKELKENQ